MSLFDLQQKYRALDNDLHQRLGRRETLKAKIVQNQARIAAIDKETDLLTKAAIFLQTLSDETRKEILDKISGIVTDALQKIKDPNLTFRMNLSTERNQIDVQFVVFDKSTNQEYDILESCGGSIADIITFPLKLSLLLKWEPSLSRIMILDENFKFVSVADQEPLGEFVRQISEKMNVQTILVTHSPVVASKAHRIIEVSKRDGISKIEERPS